MPAPPYGRFLIRGGFSNRLFKSEQATPGFDSSVWFGNSTLVPKARESRRRSESLAARCPAPSALGSRWCPGQAELTADDVSGAVGGQCLPSGHRHGAALPSAAGGDPG